MDLGRVTALLTAVALAACVDPTHARTKRDFEETGHALVGGVVASIDQGAVVSVDAPASGLSVRFRANAPDVTLTFAWPGAEEQLIAVQLDNIDSTSDVSGPAQDVVRSGKTITFDVTIPAAGAQVTVAIARQDQQVAAPFRFAWVGDVHSGLEKFARLRAVVNSDPTIEFVLFAGDLTQWGQVPAVADFVSAADALQAPWFSALGNHDTSFGNEGSFQSAIGRINFAFDYKGARFIVVDTAAATIDERAYGFLQGQLASPEPALRVVGMHIPPIDYDGLRDAGFASRAEGARFLSMLAAANVNLLLCGHLHTLHFTSNAGIQEIVSGNGGVGAEDAFDGVGMHYLAIDANPGAGTLEPTVVRVP